MRVRSFAKRGDHAACWQSGQLLPGLAAEVVRDVRRTAAVIP